MPHLSLFIITFLMLTGFLAAFIDSTVGGGGLISLPALLFVGLPPALALGTNKLAGTLSSLTSSFSFWVSRKMTVRLVLMLAPLSFLGSIVGANVAHHLSSSFLKPMVIVLLIAITGYTIINKRVGAKSTANSVTGRRMVMAMAIALVVGFYDGFFGPGTGSFLIMAFALMGFDFVQAAGNAKALNFASNIGALLTFALLNSVDYLYGLTMGIGMVLGAIVGSQTAVHRGVHFVRPIVIFVTVALIGKQLWSWF